MNHEAENRRSRSGGRRLLAEVPAIPGCAIQGETFEDLLKNLYEAVEAAMSVDIADIQIGSRDRIFEVAV